VRLAGRAEDEKMAKRKPKVTGRLTMSIGVVSVKINDVPVFELPAPVNVTRERIDGQWVDVPAKKPRRRSK
jgi:hypothetical protein